jgi:hypothetical protein
VAADDGLADLVAEAQAAEMLKAAVAASVDDILAQLRSTRMRGPFPCPSANDLGQSGYLLSLANWGRATALRSARTLGPQGVDEMLDAAGRLGRVGALLADVESAPSEDAASAAAWAVLEEIRSGRLRSPPRTAPRLLSHFLDRLGYLGETIRASQRPRRARQRALDRRQS